MITISGLDTVWVLLASMLVFFMQPGFALVEAGFTRSKNSANILMKNFVDFMVGTVLFWMLGFALMLGLAVGAIDGHQVAATKSHTAHPFKVGLDAGLAHCSIHPVPKCPGTGRIPSIGMTAQGKSPCH